MPFPRREGRKPKTGLIQTIATSAGMMLLGFAAVALPLHLLLRRELRDAPEDLRAQGWPIRLIQVLFKKYVIQWMRVEGIENLPEGSYLIASNHGYKSGVDGFILGHLLATWARRVPRIVVTGESRSWSVRAERWALEHYGIALIVPDEAGSPAARHRGLTDIIAGYLRESGRHSVILFPAGRAIADPALQLKNWSTGVVVSAQKSGCPIVPVAVGGLRLDWTPETVLLAAVHADGQTPPFHIHVRIGKPITPVGDAHAALAQVRAAVAELMQGIPALRPAPGESDPAFGKLTLRDGRTLAYMDRGPRGGTPVLYFHGFQGSRLEHGPNVEAILAKLNIRLISPDRPGMGLSTPAAGRTLEGWARDVRQLTEALLGPGEPFSIVGFSAGATYALACAGVPGLRAMALVSGLGMPHLIAGWRRLSEEAWRILLSAKLANFRPEIFLRIEKKHRAQILGHWDSYFAEFRRDMSADDQRILSRPEVEPLFRQNRQESYAQGPGYLLQEVQALYSDPRIEPSRLARACGVLIVHGADDRIVPIAVARDLHERIPGSRLIELPGRGHYFPYEETEMEAVLAELLRSQPVFEPPSNAQAS